MPSIDKVMIVIVALAVLRLLGRIVLAGLFWASFVAEMWLLLLDKLPPSPFHFVVLGFFFALALVASYSSGEMFWQDPPSPS